MLKLTLSGALVFWAAAGLPAAAEGLPPADQPPHGGVPAQIAPDPEPTANTTGGVSPTAREVMPAIPGEAATGRGLVGAAGADEEPKGAGATVPEPLVEELRQMALEQQRESATATPPPTDDSAAARERAIAAHRESLFDRVEERT